jgi:ATPase subunit of ABC transporter with duplicated ATPase domains
VHFYAGKKSGFRYTRRKTMRVFNIYNLSHSFADKSLFNGAELMVRSGDHIGLVGPNGCGKTTFLKILTGEVVPDACTIEKDPALIIGLLDQFAHIDAGYTVETYIQSVFLPLYALENQMMELYGQLPDLSEERQEKALNRAQAIQETLTEKGFGLRLFRSCRGA